MKKFLLIRHGETEVNKQGKLHSFNDSAGLTEKGRSQAEIAAEICRKQNVGIIYCSLEKRAQETAMIIANKLGISWEAIEGFQERNWGEWENLTWGEIKSRLDALTLSERYMFIPPNGESWKTMEKRLCHGLDKIKQSKNDNIALVTHGGTIRGLIPILLDSCREESFKYDPTNGEVFIFEYNSSSFSSVDPN